MAAVLGVGMIGAGLVTQAIHLPTLASLADRLRVVHVMDIDPALAAGVASRAGARHTTDADALLADPDVDVVAICSPHHLHAQQVEAACAAGKRAILCEKPLATDRQSVERIVGASRSSAIPVIVGAMHVYDPAWRAVAAAWGDLPETARLVRSVIALPPNRHFSEMATELYPPPPPPPGPGTAAGMMSGLVLGLATHAIPLVRRFAPTIDEIHTARVVAPVGYELTLRSGERIVQLLASFNDHWRPDWSLEVWGATQELRIEFPPAFVLAGSGVATLRGRDGDRRWRFGENGYQAEWRHLADVAEGRDVTVVEVEDAAADLTYGLELLDGALAVMGRAG